MRVAPVQPVRERAVPLRIVGQIGVQQVYRDDGASRAPDVVLPGAQLDRAALERDGGPVRQLPQVVLYDPLDGSSVCQPLRSSVW